MEYTIDMIYNKSGKLNTRFILSKAFKNSKLYSDIMQCTSFLQPDACFASRVYCYKNNVMQQPTCPFSGEPLRWLPNKHCFANVHGKSNVHKIRSKTEQSKTKAKCIAIQQQFNAILQQQSLKLASKQQCIDFIYERIQSTHHGRQHAFVDSKIMRENMHVLCSIIHYTQHELLNNKINWSERFYLMLHNKQPQLCRITGHKATYINILKGYSDTSSKKSYYEAMVNDIHECIKQQNFSIINDCSNHGESEYVLQCNACKETMTRKLTNARYKDLICHNCAGINPNKSKAELQIAEFLQSHGIECQRNCRDVLQGKEIDVYIADKKLGIEYHGLLWHSFGTTYPNNAASEDANKHKHLHKKNLCNAQGIQLLQIFENEWINKKSIVKSIILSKLGTYNNRIYARKCDVVLLNSQDKKQFLNSNHIQGNDNSQIALGLVYNNEIVAAMTFGSRQITKLKKYEMLRFCSKMHTQVIGGASKLLQYFLKKYDAECITTYADLRYCNDTNFYESIGFKCIKQTPPSYWYTDSNVVLHRANFQKHKLIKQGYSSSQTEKQIMLERKWRRIWDCGHLVFELHK
jgi:hypothetical protein